MDLLHPLVHRWFTDRFGAPTAAQRMGWPHIASGRNVLIAAPTGSGKTLAAFLVCLDRLLRQGLEGSLPESIQVVYISPLKALSNDIERNLRVPLEELQQLIESQGILAPPVRVSVRTGDTPASERRLMLRRPPQILVTTPESLYVLLTSAQSRKLLSTTHTVIVDEIHALARDKRGSHLALSLERLSDLCRRPPVRIGLSATQRPIDEIARFLVGCDITTPDGPAQPRECVVVDTGHVRELKLAIDTPPSELSAVCSHSQWEEVYQRLTELIQSHRSTLIFVNTRRLAERVAFHLRELLGEEAVASHHGSLSREIRQTAEQRLKSGELRAIVATASLEMGIDIGYIDLVCQIGSPRSIATFLQRVGRSGHSLGALPHGRLFPLTRDELLECMALVKCVRSGELDRIEIPDAPTDILAQQIVAAVSCEERGERELYDQFRRAWPYRELSYATFQRVIQFLSEGLAPATRRGAYLHRDRLQGKLRARKGARLAAVTSGGAIPERAEYRVVTETEECFVGSVDEDFAIDSTAGDVFLLGNTSWRIVGIRNTQVIVQDAHGAPPTIPFWFGEAPGRTRELSGAVSTLRHRVSEKLTSGIELRRQLEEECGVGADAAEQAMRYVEAQVAALGLVPTHDQIVFERFFDESGGMQLVIHSPLGMRINRAWGLALRKRFCRSFDFELQAAATDNGIVLSTGPQHSFPIESLFRMLSSQNGRQLLEQAVLAAPMFQVRWRWNVTRALAVLRQHNGKRTPPHLLKFRAEDLLAATFPETVGCLENHHGDVEIPDHPLVQQTMWDCLFEAMDLPHWLGMLDGVHQEQVRLVARDTREPSPFCYELLNANPYAFLDGAPLEERRTRAVATRRTFTAEDVRDLAKLDPQAIQQVREEARPDVASADDLHDLLLSYVVLPPEEGVAWKRWFEQLCQDGRATLVRVAPHRQLWMAVERWPMVQAIYPDAGTADPIELPAELSGPVEETDAWVTLIRGRMEHAGPTSARAVAAPLGLEPGKISSALEALEGRGIVLRGRFTEAAQQAGDQLSPDDLEWCERRLLARIHRLTMDGLRRRIRPVSPQDYLRFLVHHHGLDQPDARGGIDGLRDTLAQLQGFEAAAAAWEKHLLASRVCFYDPHGLDQLFFSGEVVWGRLRPPKRDERSQATQTAITRCVPLSLLLRNDLAWLLPEDRAAGDVPLSGPARQVLETLTQRGALFHQELLTATKLATTALEEAVRELAASGQITSDAFGAVRSIVDRRKKPPRYPGETGRSVWTAPVGRWSLFPGACEESSRETRIQGWCRLLLRRYGVVFRDLLTRESAAPPWRELVPVLRHLELRGEICGGRFVTGVSGEQYATEEVVEQLRRIRDTPDDDHWVVISATDPLNLSGIIFEGPKIPANHKNGLVLGGGRVLAIKQAGLIDFLWPVPPERQLEMRRALQLGRRDRTDAAPRPTATSAARGTKPRRAGRRSAG